MKKFKALTLALAVVMALSVFTFTAFAEDEKTEPSTQTEQTTTEPVTDPSDVKVSGDWKYKELTDKTVEIVGYTGTATECVVPSVLNEKKVVSIASGTVINNSKMFSVVIPGSVTDLQPDSFMGCMVLKSITVQSGSLQSFDIEYCPSLELIDLPENVKTIGKLEQCGMLQKISINEKNSSLKSVDGVVYSADMKTLVKYPAGKISSRFTIPSTVTAVADYAFAHTAANIKELYVPSSVAKMAANAFSGSKAQILFQAVKTPVDCEAAVKGMTVKHNQINVFAPKKVVSNQNANAIQLQWEKVAGADGYSLWYKTAKGWQSLGVTVNTTVTYSKLKPGVKYTFGIRSLVKTSAGVVASSNFITHEAATAPVATSKVVAKSNDKAILLTWAKVNGADGYAIYYKNAKGWQHYKNLVANTIMINNLREYTNYTFAVRTLIKTADKLIAGNYKEISVRTNIGTPVVTAKQTATDTVKFTWTPSVGASHYQVYYKINDSVWMSMATYNKVVIPVFKTTGLKAGTEITLAVRSARVERNKIVARSDYQPVTITLK